MGCGAGLSAIQEALQAKCAIKENIMLQRYDISMDSGTSRLSIKEFAVIGQKPRKSENYDPTLENFSLIHEVSYDPEAIRVAIEEGTEAIISELRSPAFYPIGSCAKVIAEKVAGYFNGNADPVIEVYFDDRTLLSTYVEK
jgi:hypothetical protein